jgi:hypothetical protein
MVSLPWSCRCSLVVIAIVIVAVVSIIVSTVFVVAVVINRRCHHCLHGRHLLSPSWRCSNGGAAMGAAMAEKVVAQQCRWQCSGGNGGTVMAMAVQGWLRQRSNGLGGAATAEAA